VDKDLADARAESDFRQLHKHKTWSKRDQADQNGWELHDAQLHEKLIGMRYAECWICHPELDDV
jgi:hypothetical protein